MSATKLGLPGTLVSLLPTGGRRARRLHWLRTGEAAVGAPTAGRSYRLTVLRSYDQLLHTVTPGAVSFVGLAGSS